MNATFEKTGAVTAVVTIDVVEADYKKEFNKQMSALNLHRAPHGFRPGKVPARIMERLYGEAVRADVVDEAVSKELYRYINDENIKILAQPVISKDTKVDFKNDRDYTFRFEVGMAPELKFDLKKVEIPYYKIEVTDEMVDNRLEAYRKRFSKTVPGEVSEGDSMLRGSLDELDEKGEVKNGGITVEKTVINPRFLKDDIESEKFVGIKVGDSVVFNPNTASGGKDVEIAAMLNIEKAEAANVKSDFRFTVEEIMVNQLADINEELFDNVLGKGVASTEEEFRAKLRETIEGEMASEGNYRFAIDAEKRLIEAVGDVELPDDIIKRYLLGRDKEADMEKIEAEYAKTREGIIWQLIREKVAQDSDVKVSDDDVLNLARIYASQRFAQYGMTNIPEDILDKYAKEMLDNEDTRDNLLNRAIDDKVYAAIRSQAVVSERAVDEEQYRKLYQDEAGNEESKGAEK